MNRYQTPNALRHDAHTLAENARALLDATTEITDKNVADARRRLGEALEHGKEIYAGMQEKVVRGARAADEAVHEHPYQGMAIAFSLGAVIGFLASRRS